MLMLQMHFYEGGQCDEIVVECPEKNLNNSCKVFCDDDPTTNCRGMQLYSTNGYCKDVALLSMGRECLVSSSKIYYGYNQVTNYFEFKHWPNKIINVETES